MSANVIWKPVGKGFDLGVSAPSKFIESMGRAFGDHPWTLNEGSLERLRGLAAGCSDDDNPYSRLYDIITEHGGIELFIRH